MAHRCGLDAHEIAAGVRLGHCDCTNAFAGDHAGQPTLLLLFVAQADEVRQHDVVVQSHAVGATDDTGHADLFGHHCCKAVVVGSAATELLGNRETKESVSSGFEPNLAGHEAIALPLLMVRNDLVVEPRSKGGAELIVVVVEQGARNLLHDRRC